MPGRGTVDAIGRAAWRSLAAVAFASVCLAGVCGAAPPAAGGTPGPAAVAFPLSVGADGRHLRDADGRPFPIHADTAWSLIAQLTRAEAEHYLAARRASGFNAILVSLIEHRFADNAPANAYGEPPFLVPGDFTTPNERYFDHADWVLRQAGRNGLLVLLAPAYTGFEGGAEGWYRAMAANGPQKLRWYGRYLGQRYGGFGNILWVHGGDYDPPAKDLVRAVVEGIREFDRQALHTAHCAPELAAADCWPGEAWLQVNSIYTYGPVAAPALEQYARNGHLPFFLIEGAYENEHGATARRLRTQAYQAVLSGAAGHVFGNNPIWHFDGPGLYDAPVTWQEALDGPGTRGMTHLRALLDRVPWWTLEPDTDGRLLTGGVGTGHDRAVAARAADGSTAVIYVPGRREITVDLALLAGPRVAAGWFDPTSGRLHEPDDAPLPATGLRTFIPTPDRGAPDADDWVLILESRP